MGGVRGSNGDCLPIPAFPADGEIQGRSPTTGGSADLTKQDQLGRQATVPEENAGGYGLHAEGEQTADKGAHLSLDPRRDDLTQGISASNGSRSTPNGEPRLEDSAAHIITPSTSPKQLLYGHFLRARVSCLVRMLVMCPYILHPR